MTYCAECGARITAEQAAIENHHDDYQWSVHLECANVAFGSATWRERCRVRLRKAMAAVQMAWRER